MPFLAAPARNPRKASDDPLAELLRPISGVMKMVRKVGAALIEKGAAIWNDPVKAVALAEQGSALTAELAKLALMPQDSPTRFKGKPGVAKQVAWAEPLPLDDIKTIAKALGASVNDVLLSCVAGALGEYLARKGDATDGVMIRALVPVNLRRSRRPIGWATSSGSSFSTFRSASESGGTPVRRARQHAALKGVFSPSLRWACWRRWARTEGLQEELLHALARNGTTVMTNVPGPPQLLYFAGAAIDRFLFWVPQSGEIGMGVSILSYAGQVQFGLIADRGLCPDPDLVIAQFGPEFEKLVLATLLSPWPRAGDLDPAVAARAVGAA
jgi:WS/DGAT/MGAT family acyltransferase